MKAKVHIIGICGTAMAGLAVLFKEAGFEVQGSDSTFLPPMSEQLSKFRIKTMKFSENNVKDADIVVVGNAIKRDNPEVVSAQKILSLTDALNHFFASNKTQIIVTGTHGKTTTASLIAWILEKSGFKPTFIVGGIPRNFGQSARLGAGEFFVAEGDEYDTAFFDKKPKMLNFSPEFATVGPVELDHVDLYKNLEDIKATFSKFMEKVRRRLCVVEHEGTLSALAKAEVKAEVIRYGKKGDFRGSIEKNKVKVEGKGIKLTLKTHLIGDHDLMNILASFSVLHSIAPKISEGVETFLGVKRRLEIVHEGKFTLIDDFAHHPTEVEAGLKTVRQMFPKRRIVCIFEPRTYSSRRNIFLERYKSAFSLADTVFIYRIYREDLLKDEKLDVHAIISHLKSMGKDAFFVKEKLAENLINYINKGDVIIFMSSGNFDGEMRKFLSLL